ncbi:STAS domain-containing protein [Streptomyces marispadix]|uniref:Anti-sigma factor antagonist n=1 Tax=Streptomyces marispadix TaxID=2922868 RepID=A0ABS9T1Z5_9ACTN|nr:STAS domain-containing protein [Streptomyces marispadix]MCH6162543.1 STAS domain-containing protein [Streptomyces marispadix]
MVNAVTTGDDATGEPPAQGRHGERAEEPADGPARDRTDGPVDDQMDGSAEGVPYVVSRRSERGVEVLVLAGELDLDTVQEIGPVLDGALAAGGGSVVVDLSRVSFADSSALNLLLRTHTRTRLHLCGPLQPFVERLFDVTGLSGVLTVHDSLDEAVRAAAAGD